MLIDKLGWVYVKDKRVLLARTRGNTVYFVTGGKREAGETDTEALCREIKEELSVDLLAESLKYLGKFTAPAYGKPTGVKVQLTCYMGECLGDLTPKNEVAEWRWFKAGDKSIAPGVATKLVAWLKSNQLIG